MNLYKLPSSWLLILMLPACQGPGIEPSIESIPTSQSTSGGGGAPAKVPSEVSLEDVCALALEHHPDLRRFSYDDRAADARLLIAKSPPNPSVFLDVEDFAGSGPYSGTRSAMYTASLVQILETGGKRSARSAKAAADKAQVRAEYEVQRRDILALASQDFVDALAAKEMVALAERELALAERGLESVNTQVSAGRATESQRKLAAMAVTEARLEQRRAKRGLDHSLAQLANLWGGKKPSAVRGLLTPPPTSLPSRGHLVNTLAKHPEIASARRRQEKAAAQLRMARAERYPDVELGVGTRHYNDSSDEALVVGASIPLPVFRTGGNAVKTAQAETSAAELQTESTRLGLQRRFESAWTAFSNGHDAAVTVENELLPGAREVFRTVDESYTLGRAEFLEWLEARRQLAAANRRWLEARRDYQSAAATLQALTGQSL